MRHSLSNGITLAVMNARDTVFAAQSHGDSSKAHRLQSVDEIIYGFAFHSASSICACSVFICTVGLQWPTSEGKSEVLGKLPGYPTLCKVRLLRKAFGKFCTLFFAIREDDGPSDVLRRKWYSVNNKVGVISCVCKCSLVFGIMRT